MKCLERLETSFHCFQTLIYLKHDDEKRKKPVAHISLEGFEGRKFESAALAVAQQPPSTAQMARISFPMSTTIILLCFATLAVPLLAQASYIAIIAERDDRSDAFAKVIGALFKKKRGADDEEGDYRGFCRHFQDARKVSSILARNPGAFEVIVTEVRMFFLAAASKISLENAEEQRSGFVYNNSDRPSVRVLRVALFLCCFLQIVNQAFLGWPGFFSFFLHQTRHILHSFVCHSSLLPPPLKSSHIFAYLLNISTGPRPCNASRGFRRTSRRPRVALGLPYRRHRPCVREARSARPRGVTS